MAISKFGMRAQHTVRLRITHASPLTQGGRGKVPSQWGKSAAIGDNLPFFGENFPPRANFFVKVSAVRARNLIILNTLRALQVVAETFCDHKILWFFWQKERGRSPEKAAFLPKISKKKIKKTVDSYHRLRYNGAYKRTFAGTCRAGRFLRIFA